MEVSDQFDAQTSLPPLKEPDKRLGGMKSRSGSGVEIKPLILPRNEPAVFKPVSNLYTDLSSVE
jgi:hypothetical protein